MKRLARNHGIPVLAFIAVAALCSALAAGWTNERRDRVMQVTALQSQIRDNVALYQASIYGLHYALSAEQAKAGRFEAQRDYSRGAMGDNKGYVDNLLSRIGALESALKQCDATNTMLTGDTWTGQAYIKPEGEL